jgi:hypothetical protein
MVLGVTGSPLPVMEGFDVVAYFGLAASAAGVKGLPEYAFELTTSDYTTNTTTGSWTFHFANARNLAAFSKDPWSYAPRWGGY